MTLLFTIAGTGITSLKAQHQHGDERVTLAGKALTFAEIFRSIWEQTGLQAFYNDEQLNSDSAITVNFKNARLEDVLSALLKDRHLIWYYREETFVVYRDKKAPVKNGKDAAEEKLLLTGTVTGPNDNPLPAAIQIKGANRGAHTDETGTFSLSINGTVTLLISSMGYDPKEIKVNIKSPERLRIKLTPVIKGLNEVMVIAYGTALRRNLTGSLSHVTAAEIAQQPVSNPLQALQGRVTGLNILQTSGLPGSNYKVELRGRNSISSGNDPFYIVDGVPFTATALSWPVALGSLGANASSNPLNLINIADIESIDVLKDADATAIYGSRGANGVILITTHKGRKGPAQASLNVYSGIGQVAHRVQYLNTSQYLQMRREAFHNDGEIPGATDYDMRWDSTRYTDWQKELIGGTAYISDAQMNISGGTDYTRFSLSAGYRRESTVYPSSAAYQKGSVSMRASFTSHNKKGKAQLSISYVMDQNKLPAIDLTTLSATPPNSPPPYDADGMLNWDKGAFENPYARLLRHYTADGNNLLAGAALSYELLPGLQLKTNMGFTRMQMIELQTNPAAAFNPQSYSSNSGYSQFADGNINSWIVEPQAVYDRKWNIGQHRLKANALAGMTFQQDLRSQRGLLGTGYTSDALLEDMTAAANLSRMGVVSTQYRYNAVFGRVNGILDERYILNLTGRRDGSSRFGPGSRFANFGAMGAAWIFSEETWLKGLASWLSFGKLRGSYGITGNDQISDYGYLDTYIVAPLYQGERGLMASRLYNPRYGWEKSIKRELGLDLGLLDNRLLFNVNWYLNKSSNQLVDFTLPGTTGFATIRRNLPALVSNTGFEFELSATAISTDHFTWNTSINFTIPRNKLLEFPNLQNSTYYNWYSIGQPLNIFKGPRISGVDPKTGVYIFDDTDKDGNLNYPEDYRFIKKTGTLSYGGWQHNLQWKQWQLDILFQFVQQNTYNYLYAAGTAPGANVNQPVSVLARWQRPGDHTTVQRFTQQAGTPAGMAFGTAYLSDQLYCDASFIRFKNVCLAYQLPEQWLQRRHIREAKLYIQGQNIFTITRYPGIDPETAARQETYPPLRSWVAGIRFTFF